MNESKTLTRPLAARVAGLPDAVHTESNPTLNEALIDAAFDALDAGKTHYTDRPGILPLRAWIAGHMAQHYGVTITPDEVTITCDVVEARFITIKQMTTTGTSILTTPAARARIAGAAHLAGVNTMTSVASPDQISALYLMAADAQDKIEPLLRQAQQQQWWVIFDMDGGDSTFHPAQTEALKPYTVTIGGFSASIPGWRIGWMAGSQMAGNLRAFKQSMTICSTSIAQWAAAGMVTES